MLSGSNSLKHDEFRLKRLLLTPPRWEDVRKLWSEALVGVGICRDGNDDKP
jgi:hypothetical protein